MHKGGLMGHIKEITKVINSFKNKTFTSIDVVKKLKHLNKNTVITDVSLFFKDNQDILIRKGFILDKGNDHVFRYVYCFKNKRHLLKKIKLRPANTNKGRK